MDAKSIEKSMDMHRCSPNREYGHLFSIPLYHIYSYCSRLSRSSSVSMSMSVSVFVSMCGHVLVSANNDVICLYPFFLSLLLFGGGKGGRGLGGHCVAHFFHLSSLSSFGAASIFWPPVFVACPWIELLFFA